MSQRAHFTSAGRCQMTKERRRSISSERGFAALRVGRRGTVLSHTGRRVTVHVQPTGGLGVRSSLSPAILSLFHPQPGLDNARSPQRMKQCPSQCPSSSCLDDRLETPLPRRENILQMRRVSCPKPCSVRTLGVVGIGHWCVFASLQQALSLTAKHHSIDSIMIHLDFRRAGLRVPVSRIQRT